MNLVLNLILALSLVLGQLLRIPFFVTADINTLDLAIIGTLFYGLLNIEVRNFAFPPRFIKVGLLFLLIGLISQFFSPLNLSWLEKSSALLYSVRLLLILFLGWFIAKKFLPLNLIDVFRVIILSGVTIAILGILQFLLIPDLSFLAKYGWDPHLYRLVSTFLDPNFTGSFLVLTLIAIFFTTKKNPSKLKQVIFIAVYFALLLTFSRSAYINFAITFFTLAILLRSLKMFFLTLFLIGLLFLGFIYYQKAVAVPNNVNRTASAQTRLSSWQQGLVIFEHQPILGVGFNNYRSALSQYNLASQGQIQSHGGSSNDSSLLFVLDTTGIIGLIVYLWFILEILKVGWFNFKTTTNPGLALIAIFVGLIAQSFFINTLFYPFLLVIIIMLASALETRVEKTK